MCWILLKDKRLLRANHVSKKPPGTVGTGRMKEREKEKIVGKREKRREKSNQGRKA